MRAIEIGGGALEGISGKLFGAAEDLDSCGSSAPTSVDAGPWTSVICVMIAQVAAGAAGAAEAIAAASRAVADCESSYVNADEAAHTNLSPGRR